MGGERPKIDFFVLIRGPIDDIDFKDDFIIKFLDAGVSIGEALRKVPYPPVQIAGALLDVQMQVARAFHRAVLDVIQINEAIVAGSIPVIRELGNLIKEFQDIVLGRKALELIKRQVGGGSGED